MTPPAALQRLLPLLLATLIGVAPLTTSVAQERSDPPRESGIVERSGTVLAQIDVTVEGDPEILRRLTAEDFRLKVNVTKIPEFKLDPICSAPSTQSSASTAELSESDGSSGTAGNEPAPPQPRQRPAHYLLYFDQPHLTLTGRAQALDTARQLAQRLIDDGARVMIVSNAGRLSVLQPFTDDAVEALASLDELEKDREQWTTYAEEEDGRVAEVVRLLNQEDQVGPAIAMARRFHKEEVALTDRNMRRLKLTISQLVDLPSPKAVIYFGDTLRKNSGDHYLSFFGSTVQSEDATLTGMATSSNLAGLAFDNVVNAAAAEDVRLYTVQAEGLMERMHSLLPGGAALARTRQSPTPRGSRSRDARDTLRGMAAESGGRSFLTGSTGDQIADQILGDNACLMLISFDATQFAQDQALRIVVTTPRDDIKIWSRGRLVVQSESAKRTASLLRAFGSPDSIEDPFELQATMIPTGFADGRYSALLQVSVPGTPLPTANWEIGASLVSRDKVQEEAAGQFELDHADVPVVLERELRFKPGSYEMTSVAHEKLSGMISSIRQQFDWPDPNGRELTASPISLIQPQRAAFSRDGAVRRSGSLARDPEGWVDPDAPLAMVGLICRGKKQRGALTLHRQLVGDTSTPLPPIELEFGADRCAQLRDLIPAATLGPGSYTYRILAPRTEPDVGDESAIAEVRFWIAP